MHSRSGKVTPPTIPRFRLSGGTTVRLVLSCTLIALFAAPLAVRADDTPKAASTRKVLTTKKISVDFSETRIEEIVDELKEKTGLKFILDSKGGVSRNSKLTYKGSDQTLEEVLKGL